jgi:4-diphosphocytidyl-2-C-methyl-D-erythritol kinase
MSYFKIKSYAKINLALNVVGKTNSLHKIESIVGFLDLHDEILIKKIDNKNHKIRFIGKFLDRIKSKNTVSQLLENIDKKKLLKDKYQIIIKKNIPSEAGLGGGSMNAANILKFLIKRRLIKTKNKEIIEISNSIGSDVALGLYSKNLILRSDNSIKTLSIKKKIYTLIVKPNFGCSTKKIYSQVKKFTKPRFNIISKRMFSVEFLKKMKNDLEPIALNTYPKLSTLKNFLKKLSKIEFVRMTGSGSAIIAYFNSDKKCKEAEKKVKKKFRNYWCKTSKTI